MDTRTLWLSEAFSKLPLALITHNNGKTYRVVWDGDYDSIGDSELRKVVLAFLQSLPTSPVMISMGMRREIAQFEKEWALMREESEKRSQRISDSYNYPG